MKYLHANLHKWVAYTYALLEWPFKMGIYLCSGSFFIKFHCLRFNPLSVGVFWDQLHHSVGFFYKKYFFLHKKVTVSKKPTHCLEATKDLLCTISLPCYALIYIQCSSNIVSWCDIVQNKWLHKTVHYIVCKNIDFPFAVHVCDKLCNVVLAYLYYR